MENSTHPFMFIVGLAAVINGMGIVRLLSVFSEYLRVRGTTEISHYWVFSLVAVLQLLLHIIFWWSLWAFRDTETLNFMQYLYLLCGPTLLFLASALLAPNLDENPIDIEAGYFRNHKIFFSVMSLAWLWSILLRPLMVGAISPTWPLFTAFLASTVLLRITDHRGTHAVVVVIQWALVVAFVGIFGMQLGGNPGLQF